MTPLDREWLEAHPLPEHERATDKNARGRVLVAGGSIRVPGALRLTAEAAFRAGAGKVNVGTVEAAALALGLHLPEAAVIPLPANPHGELGEAAGRELGEVIDRYDCALLGPGMGYECDAIAFVQAALATPHDGLSVLLDAAAASCLGDCLALVRAHAGRVVLTPHYGEMAALTGADAETIAADPERAAGDAAARLDAVVVLKSAETFIACPGADPLRYPGGGIGLATGGSGDVLAGLIAALLARGAAPQVAAAWGVWLHGEAGRRVAERVGPIGLLARELAAEVPTLMAGR